MTQPMPLSKTSPSPYSVHPRVYTMQEWMRSLEQRTGRSFEAWVKLVREDDGLETEKDQRQWLSKAYKLYPNAAMHIAAAAQGYGADEREEAAYLESAELWAKALFSGRNLKFKPVFDELVRVAKRLGPDVRVCPLQTHVPIFRKSIFASIAPGTKARLGVTLKLPADVKPKSLAYKRLDRKGHTLVYLTDHRQLDFGLIDLVELAYQLDV